MNPKSFLASLTLSLLILLGQPASARADDWRSNYNTENEFESCCGHKDCKTAAALGNPPIKRQPDGSYDVRVKGYWIKYHHPAVHVSEDDNVWICYLDMFEDPDPLCLFLPPGAV
jgi:hypothetical protein